MHMNRRLFTGLVGLATVAGLGLLPAAAASASTSSAATMKVIPDAVHTAKDGTAGIEALHGNSIHNMGSTLIPAPAGLNIGGVGTGGMGEQLCDPNTGQGLQIGLTSNGSSFTVEYASGVLAGAAQFACEGNGVLSSPHILNANLTGIAVGDVVKVYIATRNVHVWRHHHHVWRAWSTFQGYDQTTGAGPYTATVTGPAIWNLDSAGAGVQQNTTLMSTCSPKVPQGTDFAPNLSTTSDPERNEAYPGGAGDCNLLVAFSNIFTNGTVPGVLGFGPGLTVTGQWNDVFTSGGGLLANAALVGTNDTLYPDFQSFSPSQLDVFAGEVTG